MIRDILKTGSFVLHIRTYFNNISTIVRKYNQNITFHDTMGCNKMYVNLGISMSILQGIRSLPNNVSVIIRENFCNSIVLIIRETYEVSQAIRP